MQLQLAASPRKFLQMLLWLRLLAVIGQSSTVAIAERVLGISLPLEPLVLAIGALTATAVLTAVRLRTKLPVTQLELALQLLVDILQLTAVLYVSGGTTNPFASLFLIPLAFSAAALAWPYVSGITPLTLGCYLWLITHFRALPFMHANMMAAFDLHMVGMHVTFALSTVLLTIALALMRAEMRRRDRAMTQLRETALRNEHLNATGLLAASTAHELSTPLLSMAMLVSELRVARRIDQQFHSDLALLERQIQLCKERLTTLLHARQLSEAPGLARKPAGPLLQQVIDAWSIVRPAVQLQIDWDGLGHGTALEVDEGFSQALNSLLHNAADASATRGSDHVRIFFSQGVTSLQILIEDEGPGLDSEIGQLAGKAVFTTKPAGFGLGLVLSHANLNRLNGTVTLSNRPRGGTRTTVSMPIVSTPTAIDQVVMLSTAAVGTRTNPPLQAAGDSGH
ncbi:MAG TPA: ATP-binding protein [Steroidobacteraceae bacterium]|nr:ATP-binding protein [Steroidobacteraceae bacterium]